jgi:hypothetical protein
MKSLSTLRASLAYHLAVIEVFTDDDSRRYLGYVPLLPLTAVAALFSCPVFDQAVTFVTNSTTGIFTLLERLQVFCLVKMVVLLLNVCFRL